jgi:tetrahydromethanopterin S-methyltransferase subunit F
MPHTAWLLEDFAIGVVAAVVLIVALAYLTVISDL